MLRTNDLKLKYRLRNDAVQHVDCLTTVLQKKFLRSVRQYMVESLYIMASDGMKKLICT